jgi:DNA-binding beta-propeller fold protein YncE
MRKILRTSCLAIVVLFGFVAITCDEDCPVCPKEPEPVPVEPHRVYVYDALSQFICSIDAPADTIVDSIRIDYYGYGIFLTPDEERLLVTKLDGFTMEIYSTEDLSYLGSNNQYGDYYFDPKGAYGIWSSFGNKRLYFIDPVTLVPFDSLPFCCYGGFLDTVNHLFFGSGIHIDSVGSSIDYRIVYEIDCLSRSLVHSFNLYDQYESRTFPALEVAYNYLTGDFYCQGWFQPYWSFFYQYSIAGDSVIARWRLSAASGDIAVSPDGLSVYVTDGGNTTSDIYPRGDIYVFDAHSHALYDIIPPYDYSSGQIGAPFFGLCKISPDGRRAYLGSLSNNLGGVPLYIVDVSQNKIIKTIRPFSIFDVAAIAIGRKMK